MKKRRGSSVGPDTPVQALINLSTVSAGWLNDEGIETYAQLQGQDLVALWLRLKAKHGQVTRLMYYALWGAVHDAHWNQIPQSEKDRIQAVIDAAGK